MSTIVRDGSDEERWISILAAEARGAAIAREDAEFRRDYERDHPEVEGEAELWADLGRLGEPRSAAEMDDRAMAERVLAMGVRARRSPSGPGARRAVAVMLAAVAIAVTLGVLAAEMLRHREQAQTPTWDAAPAPLPPPLEEPARVAPGAAAPADPAPLPDRKPAKKAMHSDHSEPPEKTADALLKEAQALVAEERTDEAVTAYGVLIARHPRSIEARASRVSLGRLSLMRGDAASALDAFDRYLEGGGGPLDVEARYGRIRALRQLGRTDDEVAAIRDFLARHGDSVYAASLRARLPKND